MGLIPLHKPSRRKMEQLYIKARMHSLSNDQTKGVKTLLKSINNGYDGSVSEFKKTVLPYFDLIGWDFAVDEDGEPVFIEFNVMPEQNQISCGPSFGKLTDEVLAAVFGGKLPERF